MKKNKALVLFSVLASPAALAIQPVVMSGPVPAINSAYGAGITQTVVYTITNRVPKSLPIVVSGISGSVVRTTVANDCGNSLLPAQGATPSTCSIGLEITPTAAEIGSTINQTLSVNYQGRRPLEATISFASRQAYLYIANTNGTNGVSQCPVNLETGVISPCVNFSSTVFSGPSAITVNPARTYAYISNSTNNTIAICSIQANGFLGACVASGANGSLNGPGGSKFNNSGSLFYVTNVNSSNLIGVTSCSVNSAGLLNECKLSGTGLRGPADIALNSSNTLAYISNSTAGIDTISQCVIESNGVLGTCTPSSNIFHGPTGLSLSADGTLLYSSNRGTNQVFVCSIVAGSPFIGGCTASNPGAAFTGLNFGKNALYTDQFLFVLNQSSNSVAVCSLDGSGQLSTCTTTVNPGTTLNSAQGIALN